MVYTCTINLPCLSHTGFTVDMQRIHAEHSKKLQFFQEVNDSLHVWFIFYLHKYRVVAPRVTFWPGSQASGIPKHPRSSCPTQSKNEKQTDKQKWNQNINQTKNQHQIKQTDTKKQPGRKEDSKAELHECVSQTSWNCSTFCVPVFMQIWLI